MIPSKKTIKERLGKCLEHEGLDINMAVNAIRLEMEKAGNYKEIDHALENINNILKGHGVEAIRDNQWDSYYCDIGLIYVNMGDTYTPTVIYDTRKEKWFITSCGDIVEREEKRFDI